MTALPDLGNDRLRGRRPRGSYVPINCQGGGRSGPQPVRNGRGDNLTMAKSGAATIERIIETAERLFGLHGINGVPLRQIGREAGAANNFAVQFHFKTREGLVRAIFEHRLGPLEARREAMLAEFTEAGREATAFELLEVLFRPIMEQVDQTGTHSYAGFLAGLSRFNQMVERTSLHEMAPITVKTRDLLSTHYPELSPVAFAERFAVVSDMINTAISNQAARSSHMEFDELLAMAASALGATTAPRP